MKQVKYRLALLSVGFMIALLNGCADDSASGPAPGESPDDDAADDDAVDDDFVDDDVADDDASDDTADDDISDDDTVDDDTGDDDISDDDVDDDADDDVDDDTGDDDTFIDICEDPPPDPNDTTCDIGIRRLYCWFRAPIIVGDHVYGQLEATELCETGTTSPWDVMETCVDEIILDMFAVWIAPFVECLENNGVGTPYSARFDPADWTPPYPNLWNHSAQALNYWSYWKEGNLHELSGGFTDVQGNSVHGAVAWGEIGYGYLGALFATGDSTVFNSVQLEIPMNGYIVGMYYIYPFYAPWSATLEWTH